jgi:hypothetical protein
MFAYSKNDPERGVRREPTATIFDLIAEDRRVEALKGDLIVSYETAVGLGLQPAIALAAILEWAAQECARVSEK